MGDVLEDRYGIPRRRLTNLMSPWCLKRLDEFGGDISRFRVIKINPSRIRQIAIAKTEPGDENNQDILARRQGGHPQARGALAGRSRRLQLPERSTGRTRACSSSSRCSRRRSRCCTPAHRDPGGQLRGHREHRRPPVRRHHHGALERVRVAELPGEQEQRGLHRPDLRHQGPLLPAGHGGAEDLREADPDLGTGQCPMCPGDALLSC